MAGENDDKKKNDTFRWIVGSLITLLAAGSGIAALLTYFRPPQNNNSSPQVRTDSHSTEFSSNFTTDAESPTPRPASNRNSSNKNKPSQNDEPANDNPAPKVDCKIDGTVYNADNNGSPMSNVRVYLTDGKHPDVFLGSTNPSGIFTGDCSQIPADNFPKKLKARTPLDHSLIEHELLIPQTGRKGAILWVSEKSLNIARNRTEIIKKMATRIDPRIINQSANKQ